MLVPTWSGRSGWPLTGDETAPHWPGSTALALMGALAHRSCLNTHMWQRSSHLWSAPCQDLRPSQAHTLITGAGSLCAVSKAAALQARHPSACSLGRCADLWLKLHRTASLELSKQRLCLPLNNGAIAVRPRAISRPQRAGDLEQHCLHTYVCATSAAWRSAHARLYCIIQRFTGAGGCAVAWARRRCRPRRWRKCATPAQARLARPRGRPGRRQPGEWRVCGSEQLFAVQIAALFTRGSSCRGVSVCAAACLRASSAQSFVGVHAMR